MTNESIWDKVDLIEKRFENRLNKSNVKFNTLNPVWDNEKENTLNVFEMIDELNYLNDCCDNLIDDNTEYVAEINQMHKENEQLKKVLGAILVEVKRDISNTNQTGEIKVFINPNSFDLISEVLRKYGALKEWYE